MKDEVSPELGAALRSEESGALTARIRAGDPKDLESLRALVRDRNTETGVRRKALWALGMWGSPRAVPDIEAALEGLRADEIIAAVDALGRIGTERALNAVVAYANDPSDQVRKFVALALSRMRLPRAKAKLAEMASEDPQVWIRKLATDKFRERRD